MRDLLPGTAEHELLLRSAHLHLCPGVAILEGQRSPACIEAMLVVLGASASAGSGREYSHGSRAGGSINDPATGKGMFLD